jgi:hypothetical protein
MSHSEHLAALGWNTVFDSALHPVPITPTGFQKSGQFSPLDVHKQVGPLEKVHIQ